MHLPAAYPAHAITPIPRNPVASFHQRLSAEPKKLNLEHRIPLRRKGTPEQVAQVILQLVLDDYVTGDTETIDGGPTSRIA